MSPGDRPRIRNVTVLVGSSMTVLAGAILAPALPGMAAAFSGVANFEFLVKLVLTMPALSIAVSAPLVGVLLDRWGRRPVLFCSLALYALAGGSGFFLHTLTAILIARAVLGVGVAGLMSGFTTVIVDSFSGARLNRFMGYQGAFMGLAGMVYVMLGGWLADFGWRFPFLIYLSAVLVLPGVYLAVAEPGGGQKGDRAAGGPAAADGGLPWRSLAGIYFAALSGMLIFYVVPVQLPFFLTGQLGTSNVLVGLALGLQTPTAVALALLYGRVRARWSFQAISALVFVSFGVCYLVLAVATDFWLVTVGLMIGGLGLGLLPPNLNSWAAAIAPPARRGQAMGGLAAFLFLGQFLVPIVTQPLVGQLGSQGLFATVGGASLLLMLLFAGAAARGGAKTAGRAAP